MAGKYDIGPRVGIEGEKALRDALKDITTSMKMLDSEMRVVTSSFSAGEKSQASLGKQNEILTKKIKEQKAALAEMGTGLENAKAQFGENSAQAQQWQTSINNATANLNKMERELEDNTAEIKNLEKAQKSGGDQSEKYKETMEKVGAAAKATAVAVGAFAVAAGAAALKLGKEVVSAYADYEQLVGGIDTLFKDSSGEMQKYASNAYKTAGLSANEYMETVTGFSASLIQSLGGDTNKAVKYADMAITDMSDNANKMGTDMASIQNAYQGFAKQNYTMLDNLKLGYGGTKEEMARLLVDAEKISGIKYDLSSYADVVDAIHVVQTEMGITGTTALEAEHTISGSLGSLQSALSNLVVGFGDANADMGQLAGNVIDAFKDVVTNITPVIQNIVAALPEVTDALLTALADMLPMLLQTATTLFEQVLSTLIALLPTLIPAAVDAIMTIVGALVDNLPLLIGAAIQIVVSLMQGITDALPELIPAAVDAIMQIVEALVDNIDMLVDAALDLVMGLADGLIKAIPALLKAAPTIITKLVRALVDNIPMLLKAAMDLILALTAALIDNLPLIIDAGIQVMMAVIQGILSLMGDFPGMVLDIFNAIVSAFKGMDWGGIGKNLIDGIKNGIVNSAKNITKAAKDAAKAALDGVKNFLGIRSPSKVMEKEVGAMMGEGISGGFVKSMKSATRKMQDAIPTQLDASVTTTYRRAVSSATGATNANPGLTAQDLAAALVGLEVKMEGKTVGRIVSRLQDQDMRSYSAARGVVLV